MHRVIKPLSNGTYKITPPDYMLSFSHITHGRTFYDFSPYIKAVMKTQLGGLPEDTRIDDKTVIGSLLLVDWLVSFQKPYLIKIAMAAQPDDIYEIDENLTIMYDHNMDYLWVRSDDQEIITLLVVKFAAQVRTDHQINRW